MLQTTIGTKSPAVARAVVAQRSRGRQEARRRGRRVVPVAQRQVRAAHDDLAGGPGGDLAPMLVGNEHLHVGDGIADRHDIGHRVAAAERELAHQPALGGAEAIDENAALVEVPREQLEVEPRHTVALKAHDAHGAVLGSLRSDRAEDARHRVVDRDTGFGEPAAQSSRPLGVQVEQARCAAVEQGAKQARHRAAERRTLQQRHAVAGMQPQGVRVPHDVMQHVAVVVEHALGLAGGAGSEVDVGQVARPWARHFRGCAGWRRIAGVDHLPERARESERQRHRRPVGNDQVRPAALDGACQPPLRKRRIERHVGPRGAQHAEDRNHQHRLLLAQNDHGA